MLEPPKPAPPAPKRRGWVLLLATLLAVAAGAGYFYDFAVRAERGADLLQFTALYITCPLALSVICLFAYYKYPAK